MISRFSRLALIGFFLIGTVTAHAKLNVVTTLPDLQWLVGSIAGPHADVESLLSGTENPHYADAVPRYIQKVANADIVCLVGLDLELGWLPKVLTRSGNAKVQPGSKGYCNTGSAISVLQKPTSRIDRSMGDVHPFGNPHYTLSPTRMIEAAKFITQILITNDSAHQKDFEGNLLTVTKTLRSLHETIRSKFDLALKNNPRPFMEYHQDFVYYFDDFKIYSIGSLEEKPGIPPSAGTIAQKSQLAKSEKVQLLLAPEGAPHRTLEKFSEISGVPIVTVNTFLRPSWGKNDYRELHHDIANAIIARLQTGTPR